MTRITNADQVLLLLRGHLQRAERSRRGSSVGASARKAKPTPLERVQTIAQAEALTDEEIKRALISGIFAEEFGSSAANDPKFQLMVDDVLKLIRQDEIGGQLLDRAVAQLVGGQ